MKVAFLDRDGLINKDFGYVYKWENFEYQKLVKFSLMKLLSADFHLIILTNQSGIARGYYTEQDFDLLTSTMTEDLKKSGIDLLDVFCCPHHPEGIINKYAIDCNCRKPKPGLFLKAFEKYDVDFDKSVMFGDNVTDLDAAKAAGIMKTFLVVNEGSMKQYSVCYKNLDLAVNKLLSFI